MNPAIKFIRHTDIDREKWDACIQHSSNGMIYARSWYLDIVSPGWNAMVEGNYESVFPLTWKKKYGIHYLYQPFFTQQLGLFAAKKNLSSKKISEFISAIPEQYRFIEIQLNAQNTCQQKEFNISERLTHHLSLAQSDEKIHTSYAENLARNIRRAKKNNIEVHSDVNATEIINLFRKNKGKEISNLGSREYNMLLQLIDAANTKQLISILGVRNVKGKLIAGAVFLRSEHGYVFFFSATDAEARSNGAMSLIIDDFVRTHAGENNLLDFEGSMNKNLARFYKSFGSKEVVYLHIRKNSLPPYIKWIKK